MVKVSAVLISSVAPTAALLRGGYPGDAQAQAGVFNNVRFIDLEATSGDSDRPQCTGDSSLDCTCAPPSGTPTEAQCDLWILHGYRSKAECEWYRTTTGASFVDQLKKDAYSCEQVTEFDSQYISCDPEKQDCFQCVCLDSKIGDLIGRKSLCDNNAGQSDCGIGNHIDSSDSIYCTCQDYDKQNHCVPQPSTCTEEILSCKSTVDALGNMAKAKDIMAMCNQARRDAKCVAGVGNYPIFAKNKCWLNDIAQQAFAKS